MIQGLKECVPIVVKASPEVTLTSQWLADKVSDCITSLGQVGFKVRGIVVDNLLSYLLSTFFKQGFLLDALIYYIRTILQKLFCFLTMFIWLKTFVTIY